jgi:hypothetical protein
MSRIDAALTAALRALPAKPPDTAKADEKKGYSEKLSATVALVLAEELRKRGCREVLPLRPDPGEPLLPGLLPKRAQPAEASGAERRMAGGIGAKKVDVTWATPESGLILGISVKTINFRDRASGTFQKNLTNRRGDMLMEAVTLHRRFPYAVLGGFFFLDKGAASDHEAKVKSDGTARRRSTFLNAHARLRLFTGRADPAGRDEQYERFYILLVDATPEAQRVDAFEVGKPDLPVALDRALDDLLTLVAERNPDFYEFDDGRLVKVAG